MSIQSLAKKTFLALTNPYHSIKNVYPLAIDEAVETIEKGIEVNYVGVKNTNVIPSSLLKKLRQEGFIHHTTDPMALGGRAIDLSLRNPITNQAMSGSSSATAINVFLGINDLGVGTDGGGSVLAPAGTLNLFGFISPLIEAERMGNYAKKSTDGISFTPSIGYITRDYKTLQRAVQATFDLSKETEIEIILPKNEIVIENIAVTTYLQKRFQDANLVTQLVEYPDIFQAREALFEFVRANTNDHQILVSWEGPIDLLGFGDSVFGHFDERTRAIQRNAYKGLLRVINMVNKSAIIVPTDQLGCGILLICESRVEMIGQMLKLAEKLQTPPSPLIQSYFLNHDHYFKKGFMEE